MEFMTIGDFAERTRLSPKALRLYDRLGLLAPAQVDPVNGYRLYREDQVEPARLVGLLRRLDMPLSVIAEVLVAGPGQAPDAVGRYWAQVESATEERRALASYIQARLQGADMATYDIQTRSIPERRLAAISRHLHLDQTDAFFAMAFARLRSTGPALAGMAGYPFLVFYGEVSADSDGPIELCRPVASPAEVPAAEPPPSAEAPGTAPADTETDVQLRIEPAHDEVFIRVALKDMGWPALLPATNALEAWVREHHRQPAGPLRQVLIADQRSATPDTPVCDLTVPLK